MPVQYKLLVSALIILVGVAVFYFDSQTGRGFERWLALILGLAMAASIWIFPEAKAREIRKEAAKRR